MFKARNVLRLPLFSLSKAAARHMFVLELGAQREGAARFHQPSTIKHEYETFGCLHLLHSIRYTVYGILCCNATHAKQMRGNWCRFIRSRTMTQKCDPHSPKTRRDRALPHLPRENTATSSRGEGEKETTATACYTGAAGRAYR